MSSGKVCRLVLPVSNAIVVSQRRPVSRQAVNKLAITWTLYTITALHKGSMDYAIDNKEYK